ncbi:UNVERIFIED_ORG: hypothetical protein M2414_005386 [Rahnella aquatilis]
MCNGYSVLSLFNVRYFKEIILAMFIFSLSNMAVSAEVDEPETIVREFYKEYLINPATNKDDLVGKYVFPDVIQSIKNSTYCNYDSDDAENTKHMDRICAKNRECRTDKGSDICNWDGVWVETDVNYFTKSQDAPPSWGNHIETVSRERLPDSASFDVTLGEKPDYIMKLRVTLKYIGSEWKISGVTAE